MWYVPACERQRRDVIFCEFVIRIKTGGSQEDKTQMTCTVVVMFQQVSIVPTESVCLKRLGIVDVLNMLFLRSSLSQLLTSTLCTLQDETSAN